MRYVNDKDLGYNPIDNQLGTLEKRNLRNLLISRQARLVPYCLFPTLEALVEFQRRFSPHPTPPLTLQPTPTCRLTGLLLVFQANPISITTKENRASPSLSPIPKTNTSRHSLRENEFDRPRFNCALSEDDFRFFLSFFLSRACFDCHGDGVRFFAPYALG